MTEQLLVFAKAPVPGQVKTRLIPLLGAQGACLCYQQLLRHCLQRFSPSYPIQLWCAPDEHHPFFQKCHTEFGLRLYRQQGSELGVRMAYALAQAPGPALLMGSDCPSLQLSDIQQGFSALKAGYEVVLAPTEDGGYALIGMQRLIAELFSDMPWSTPEVLELTRAHLLRLGIRWWELPLQWDVDRPEDVHRWQQLEAC
ncbi:MAG: TIGR04282 family arsenosugar biosynthesis glycosyltransferase [Pseudomonadota bacterium]|nr:TIGR04282 family arsenosugar biosynthesis glycosyltransferase [Pseudomonadota bacterium]